MKILRGMLLGALLLVSSQAYAGTFCTEQIWGVIVHLDENIYFTSTTCPGWCKISFATSQQNTKGYAMLLSAITTGHSVSIYWPNRASQDCTTPNPLYAAPQAITLLGY